MAKNILITGGSSGIGEGLARYFHAKGWSVLITGRNTDRLNSLAASLPGLNTITYDSLEKDAEAGILEFIIEKWSGKLDVLINNAGHVALTPITTIARNALEEMYKVHLIAPSMLTSGCIDFLKKTKGQIINISSSHGIKAFAELSAYGSAKAGLNMLTSIWALELAAFGIRVNSVAPGPTNTPVLENAGLPADLIQAIHTSERTTIPLQRRGDVSDIVANTALLIESGSAWVTGVVFPVDGGVSVS